MDNTSLFSPSLIERFWSKVNKNGPVSDYAPHLGPCWLWTGAKNQRSGYAVMRVADKTMYAHRVSHAIHKGRVPVGMDTDHLCRVRHCVNPAHLESVTRKVNIERGTAYARRREQADSITACKYGHKYTPENTYTRPNGNRACRECRRIERQRRHEQAA